MASLSLPRVLHLKKNSVDAEREQFEKFLTLAVQKAINGNETPVKEKHVRSTIIGTFQDQSAATYWMVAIRQPLQDNRIVAWKFCHVTHKLLREGHPACLEDSQRHIKMIGNLGKLWVHLREGYGKLVHLYCKLLICKLQFHARNPRFPGNMQVSSDELDSIAENDVNNYFQICVELFDYMDDILTLQEAVFESLGNARANSMTASGQCRLAALIPCAQDASHMYDCNVRLLFRLHAALPADTLVGHRDRFRQQFKKLSLFYKHASNLQYYRNLLTLPVLPSNPPNFLLQSDFGTYVTPVVSIPEQPPDEPDHIGSLIDTSDTMTQASTPEQVDLVERASPSPQPELLQERDSLIDHLQTELRRMRLDTSQMVQERNTMLTSMREHCTRLETQLQAAKCELHEEKVKVETLSAQTPEMTKKLTMVEEKAKVQDEKFQKLKSAYTQLRAEHINLIRQKAEVDKQSANLRAATAEHESSKLALQQQLNDRIKDVELLQQSTSSSEEIDAYKSEIDHLRSDLEQSRLKETQLETLRASMETLQIDHKAALAEYDDKLNNATSEIKEFQETIDRITKEKDIEVSIVKEELKGLRERSEDEYKKVVEEKEMALEKVNLLNQQYNQEKQMLKGRLEHSETERLTAESGLQDLLQQNSVLEKDMVDLKQQLQYAQEQLEKQRTSTLVSGVHASAALTCAAEEATAHDSRRNYDAAAAAAGAALADLAAIKQISSNEETIAKSVILAAHNTAQLSTYAMDVSNTSTNTEVSEKLTKECREMLANTKKFLDALSAGSMNPDSCCQIQKQVAQVLKSTASADTSKVGETNVDDELAEMDKAIEDAAGRIEEMLAASRATDSGLKLEVNNSILDACTTLMAAVKVLVRDSRRLQAELGDPRTRIQMYRKNPQWSEGLISAAKAVVFAAKLLVTSADEAVGSEGRVEGVAAAAHEVAGSTAQLVAASRARAPPAAPALAALTAASRHVAAAAGAVLAAARAASARAAESGMLDTSSLSLTATRRLEMESKVRALELEVALDAERGKLAALRKRHYTLAQQEENGNMTNGK